MPPVAAEVMRKAEDPDSDLPSIAQIISRDASLAVRVLKIANSSFYSMPRKIETIQQAIVLLGYSTSYAWPAMLQHMLDQHSGGERVYHVLNAVIGGSPVGRWIAPEESDDYVATYEAMRRDFFGADARLRAAAPVPLVPITLYRALKDRREAHRRIARFTFPIWMYVSVTGVLVYLVLSVIFPAA